MKFPGQRKSKHYFPVDRRDPLIPQHPLLTELEKAYVVGIDQTLVDIEAHVDDGFLRKYGLSKGHSVVITDDIAEQIYQELKTHNMVVSEFAGGTIGNTMHNYSVLADSHSILLGVMSQDIRIGSYAYRYLCNTSSRVNLDYLQPVAGPIGRCFTFITECGERSFGINAGKMNQLDVSHIPEEVIKGASALVITAYLVRGDDGDPMKEAAMKAVRHARAAGVPVVLTLGTRFVIADNPEWWRDFIAQNVTVLAMNEDEAEALTGIADPLGAADKALDWADMVLCTAGPVGLYMASYTDEDYKRETTHTLLPGVIPEFNMYEFSRPMARAKCRRPARIYSHISPYMGGPEKIKNTNGAGDGALSAVLHDMVANAYHRMNVPNSAKHLCEFLTYSSLAQVCKYANRVSYEVLAQSSPRLSRGLPEKEDSLEEVYWER
ncbi:inosine/guanosine kinase [Aeromonas cavernicola]|uniref:Guanosine-inosine kinase n=1 Tax=Aeromonas cavernicola TaxID=1006623 RepID=A0A2H9U619_9GAMM|nr:inosine/guanosine kinase [Aeromonas cavernicola]PJG59487.1 inosine/guanosine kinase [Aeromonas cavernicola]